MPTTTTTHRSVSASIAAHPVIGVVRTDSFAEAEGQARTFLRGGLELVEVTFTVPRGSELVRKLRAERDGPGPPWIGMGTVTTRARAREAIACGAEFIVSPNASPEVAQEAKGAGLFLVLGALTPTEIVQARLLGADLVKVYPLPMVGGASYLATVRQPLSDIPMLAAGGFDIEEIPSYRAAGASAYGLGSPLLGRDEEETCRRVRQALAMARGEKTR